MSILSFTGYTPWKSYLEKLTIDDKYMNKRVCLFIHQTLPLSGVERKKLVIEVHTFALCEMAV